MNDQTYGIHISSYLNAIDRHGGAKRSAQLSKSLESQGFDVVSPPSTHKEALRFLASNPWSALVAGLHAIALYRSALSFRGFCIATLYGTWLYSVVRSGRYESFSLEISPNLNVVLGNMLTSFGVKFDAYPHNIEFLVPGSDQTYFRSLAAAFQSELRVYKGARKIWTISDFDKNILRCLGVEGAEKMEYVPSDADCLFLEHIRRCRVVSNKRGVLILGFALNPPTREGMSILLKLIENEDAGRQYTLAGYGTESLSEVAPPNVAVMGSVSAEKLEELLVECQALLIYQVPTSGMLTRLVEASFAHVPVYVLGGYYQASEFRSSFVVEIQGLRQIEVP